MYACRVTARCRLRLTCFTTQAAASSVSGGAANSVRTVSSTTCADDSLMLSLQQSYDAITGVTQSIKRLGQDLMRSTCVTESGQVMVSRGVALCKEMSSSSDELEILLTTPRPMVMANKVIEVLQAAAKPFQNLQAFQQELSSLRKLYCKTK